MPVKPRQGVDRQLVGKRVNAEVGGGVFVLLDGSQAHPELLMHDEERRGHGQGRHVQRRVVMLELMERPVSMMRKPLAPPVMARLFMMTRVASLTPMVAMAK